MDDRYQQVFVRLRKADGEPRAPRDLRPRLVADAERDGSNLTEVTIKILAEHYRIPFDATGRRTKPKENADELNLRLPMKLYQAIAHAAVSGPRSVQDEIIATLAAHYGLAIPLAAVAAA